MNLSVPSLTLSMNMNLGCINVTCLKGVELFRGGHKTFGNACTGLEKRFFNRRVDVARVTALRILFFGAMHDLDLLDLSRCSLC